MSSESAGPASPFGRLLRAWRVRRGETQLSLALRAGSSTRHLSFIETGRSTPSRDMVLLLGETLDLPLRERNRLLQAAGYASVFRETDLAGSELNQVRRVLAFILERLEPYPALVVNGRYDVVMTNPAALRVFAPFLGSPTADFGSPPNLLRMVCSKEGLADTLVDGAHVADAMLERAERASGISASQLLDALQIEAPAIRSAALPRDVAGLLLPVHLKNAECELRLLSTFTTIGGARDVTLQELQIECFLPADDASDRVIRRLAQGETP